MTQTATTPRDRLVHIRLTAREQQLIAARAAEIGMSVSAYMRLCAIAAPVLGGANTPPLDNTTNKSGR